MCKGKDGETSPHLWATEGGWQYSWRETTGLGWGVGAALAQRLALAFADVSAQRVHYHCQGVCVSVFWLFSSKNLIPSFYHLTFVIKR